MKNKLIIVTLSLLGIGSSGGAYDLRGPVGQAIPPLENLFYLLSRQKVEISLQKE